MFTLPFFHGHGPLSSPGYVVIQSGWYLARTALHLSVPKWLSSGPGLVRKDILWWPQGREHPWEMVCACILPLTFSPLPSHGLAQGCCPLRPCTLDPNQGKAGVSECPWGWQHCTSQVHTEGWFCNQRDKLLSSLNHFHCMVVFSVWTQRSWVFSNMWFLPYF